ncbi:MAG: hypothetical protein QW255_04500 [Candidatus Bilamarchaeaceae archaeon]
MILFYKGASIMLIKDIKTKDYLEYKKNIVLSLKNKLPQSIRNKFSVRVNNFVYYTELVKKVKNTKSYKKPIVLLDKVPTYRMKLSGNKFIILGNHGYSKNLNILFGFDYYTHDYSTSNVDYALYFQVIVLNGQSELVFVINNHRTHNELFEVYLEYDSHKEILLDGITGDIDNSINLKTYFENYKRLVKDKFNNSKNKIYEYEFSYEAGLKYDRVYPSAFCKMLESTKKGFYEAYVLKPPLSSAIKLFYTQEYLIITKQKICTSFISIKENLYNIYIHNETFPLLTLSYESKKMYIIQTDQNLLITDKLMKEDGNNTKKLSMQQLLDKLIQINVNILTNIKETFDDYILEKDENGNYFIYNKKQKISDKITQILENIYIYIFEKGKKATLYDKSTGIKQSFTYSIIFGSLHKEYDSRVHEHRNRIKSNWNVILYNRNYYITNLHNHFMLYFLDLQKLDGIEKFFEKNMGIIDAIKPNYLFWGPIKVNLVIMRIRGGKELFVNELPDISETILMIDDNDKEKYVFSIHLLKGNTRLSRFRPSKTAHIYSIHYEVSEKNALIKRFELSLVETGETYDEYTNFVFNSLKHIGHYSNIYFTFSVTKEKWEKLKCLNDQLAEIYGYFYFRMENYGNFYFSGDDGDGIKKAPITFVLVDKNGRTRVVE